MKKNLLNYYLSLQIDGRLRNAFVSTIAEVPCSLGFYCTNKQRVAFVALQRELNLKLTQSRICVVVLFLDVSRCWLLLTA